jgi:hypothetical protein
MAPGAAQGSYYRYEGPDGRVHITDSIDHLPAQARASAGRVEYQDAPSLATGAATASSAPMSTALAPIVDRAVAANMVPRGLDATSFVFGFGTALALAAVLFLVAKGSRLVLKVVVGVGIACLLGAAYLGVLRRSVGQGDGILATPGEMIKDAQDAVRAAEERQLRQQRLIEELEADSRN